jgi:hypothetical protein
LNTARRDEPEPLAFPEDWCPSAEVRSWIASTLGARTVTGPTDVLRVKDWGATASFVVGHVHQPMVVVFHVCRLALFDRSPGIHRLLAECCPGRVPHLLAAAERSGQTWTLFRHFDGTPAGSVGRVGSLIELARAFAVVQTAVAAALSEWTADLPRCSIECLPDWLDDLIGDIEARYEREWEADDGRLRRRLGIPGGMQDRLARCRSSVVDWTAELQTAGWPESIDHVDLHANNAVFQPARELLIFDWEEAVMGLPFFSLDRLLYDARRIDLPDEPFPPAAGAQTMTPSMIAVREAYISALPWATLQERRRAATLALLLAPIKAAHENRVFDDARGRSGGNAFLAGWFAVRTLEGCHIAIDS